MDLTIDKDLDSSTLTVVAMFAHPREKVWDLYADPRKMERIWGPPTHPATVTRHELRPGGIVQYFMTSPEGERFHGLWNVTDVVPLERFSAQDLFADADGNAMVDMPATTMTFVFSDVDSGTQMQTVATYTSREAMEQVLAMGMLEGMQAAMGQIDGVLAES